MKEDAKTERESPPARARRGCLPTRADSRDQVWSFDLITEQAVDGQWVVMLPIVDEYTRECLAIEVDSSMTAQRVVSAFERLFHERPAPVYIRSDTASDEVVQALEDWLATAGSETFCAHKGDPWAQSYAGSFKNELREGLLNLDLFRDLTHAECVVEGYRQEYNHRRPQRELGYVSPSTFAAGFEPAFPSSSDRLPANRIYRGRRSAPPATPNAGVSYERWRRRVIGTVLAVCLVALGVVHFPTLRAAAQMRFARASTLGTIDRPRWTSDFAWTDGPVASRSRRRPRESQSTPSKSDPEPADRNRGPVEPPVLTRCVEDPPPLRPGSSNRDEAPERAGDRPAGRPRDRKPNGPLGQSPNRGTSLSPVSPVAP